MKSILARIILSLSSGCVNQRLDEPRNTCLSPGRFQLHRYASRALCVSSSFPRATTVDCMLDVMPKNLWRFRDKRCRNASEFSGRNFPREFPGRNFPGVFWKKFPARVSREKFPGSFPEKEFPREFPGRNFPGVFRKKFPARVSREKFPGKRLFVSTVSLHTSVH